MRRLVFALVALGVVALEVFVLVQVGQLVGWWLLPLLVLTSLVGGWLVRREGAKAWSSLAEAVRAGQPPSGQLGDAAVVFAGGLLILVPGFVTDAAGALVVLPFTRPLTRRLFQAAFGRRLADLERSVPPTSPTAAPGQGGAASDRSDGSDPSDGQAVQGRVVSRDDTED